MKQHHQLQISSRWYSWVLITISDDNNNNNKNTKNFRFVSAIRTVRNRSGILKRKPLLAYLGYLNVSKMTDPKAVSGAIQVLLKSYQIKAKQDGSLLTGQRFCAGNGTKVILGCLTDSPRIVFSMVFHSKMY